MGVLKFKDGDQWVKLPAIKGDPGKSAYQTAVEGGYTGTEAEFNQALMATMTETKRASVTLTAAASTINIPFTITDTNGLTVWQNGLLLEPATNYTATTTAITLNGYTAEKDDIFTFVSSIPVGNIDSISATNVVTAAVDGATNVEDALSTVKPHVILFSATDGSCNHTFNDVVKYLDAGSAQFYYNNVSGHVAARDNTTILIQFIEANGNIIIAVLTSDNHAEITPYGKSMYVDSSNMARNVLVANSTSVVNYTTAQMRNITLSTTTPTTSDGKNGDIWFVYQA